jgi:hypothetical protein
MLRRAGAVPSEEMSSKALFLIPWRFSSWLFLEVRRKRENTKMRALKLSLLAAFTAGSLLAAGAAVARHGGDNPRGDVRDCRGCDDPANHDAIDDRNQDVNDVDVMDDMDAIDADEALENQMDEHHPGRDGGRDR